MTKELQALAALIPNGNLLAATNPTEFVIAVTNRIQSLEREHHRQRVKLKNRAAFIIELWQGMQAVRQWIRGEFRDGPLGDPAARSWACLWCGEMLTGREHAKEHCAICPESPLVKRIDELLKYIDDQATSPDDQNAVS